MSDNLLQLGILTSLALATADAWGARLLKDKRTQNLFWVGFTSGAFVLYMLLFLYNLSVAKPQQSQTLVLTPTPSPQIKIIEPKFSERVVGEQQVKGIASNLPNKASVWIFTGQTLEGFTQRIYWVQRGGPIIPASDGTWNGKAYIDPKDGGKEFEIRAVISNPGLDTYLQGYLLSWDKPQDKQYWVPFFGFPPFKEFLAQDFITVIRQ